MSTVQPTETQIKAFIRAANALAKLGEAGLILYLANDTLHLLNGPSHEDRPGRNGLARQDRIVESVYIPGASGGDW